MKKLYGLLTFLVFGPVFAGIVIFIGIVVLKEYQQTGWPAVAAFVWAFLMTIWLLWSPSREDEL